jgi:hypothetical protein
MQALDKVDLRVGDSTLGHGGGVGGGGSESGSGGSGELHVGSWVGGVINVGGVVSVGGC